MNRWIQTAQQRWPGIPVTGNDRFALCNIVGGKVTSVYLLASREACRAGAHGFDRSEIVDLVPTPVPDLPDDWEDRKRERRERREATQVSNDIFTRRM